jgi:hypothetical protein
MKQILKNIGWFILMYLFNIILEIDIFCNVVFFFGQPGETISSHFGRSFPNSLFAIFIDWLFFWQKVQSHCRNAALTPTFNFDESKDLIPKKKAEQRIAQILITSFFIFIIIWMVIK